MLPYLVVFYDGDRFFYCAVQSDILNKNLGSSERLINTFNYPLIKPCINNTYSNTTTVILEIVRIGKFYIVKCY